MDKHDSRNKIPRVASERKRVGRCGKGMTQLFYENKFYQRGTLYR